MVKFVRTEEMDWKQLTPLIKAKIVTGNHITAQLVHLEKGTTMEVHQHTEEQLGFVLDGKLKFIVGPNHESHIVEAGSIFYFESNEIHGVGDTPEKTVVIDIFGPVRKDYLHLAVDMTEG
ncbi:MAG: cupin domain-containing protein [Candidatus Heimdallarchaeota archaeon]